MTHPIRTAFIAIAAVTLLGLGLAWGNEQAQESGRKFDKSICVLTQKC